MMPGHRDDLVIACGADDQYVQHLAVMLQSVLANLDSDRRLAVYVLHGGIQESHRLNLMRLCRPDRVSLRFLEADKETLAGLPLWGRMTVATYYKLLVTELLPSAVSRAIWLDCDVVVTEDLGRLWDTDLGGRHALAVQDNVVPLLSSPRGVSHYQGLGLPAEGRYFNAGVMLLDINLLRRDKISARAIEYLLRHRDNVVFWDQEALNAVLAGKWGSMDRRWNFMADPHDNLSSDRRDSAWIHHFAGNVKPWIYPTANPSHLLYYHYLDQTAWAGWRPERSLAGAVITKYLSSPLRAVCYPAEEWLMKLIRTLTKKYAA